MSVGLDFVCVWSGPFIWDGWQSGVQCEGAKYALFSPFLYFFFLFGDDSFRFMSITHTHSLCLIMEHCVLFCNVNS